jgi:glycerophosphoryl diester phosphodiesterase
MKIIGHRGARGLAPENTLASLRKAVEHGVDMVEFDLRVTSDNVVVLHHDPRVQINDESLSVADSTYKQLKAVKSDLAALPEVLAEFASTPLYIEVKPGVKPDPIIALIKSSKADTYLASKDQKILVSLREALPEAKLIVIEPWSGVRGHQRARQVNAKIIAMNQRWLWWGFIIGFKNSDRRLYAYTVNDPKKARRWARWGLAGVVTDYPDRF